jgi:hypothetical protein
MVNIAQVLKPGITGGYTQDFVIAPGFIGHAEHANGPTPDDHAGESGLLDQHEGIEGVTVQAEGVFNEAVVVGVAGGGEQHSIKANTPGVVVDFVFIATAPRNFNGDVKFQWLHDLNNSGGEQE